MMEKRIDSLIKRWYKEGFFTSQMSYWGVSLEQLLKIEVVRKEAKEALTFYDSISS